MASQLKHGGNLRQAVKISGFPQEQLLDFSASINPLGFPSWLRPLISSQVSQLSHYPDPEAEELVYAIAAHHQLDPSQVIIGNGASELLYLLPQVLGHKRALITVPCYGDYLAIATGANLHIDTLALAENDHFQLNIAQLETALTDDHLVILGHPNNPTGKLYDVPALQQLIRNHPQNHFIIDESFIDFADPAHSLRWQQDDNVIIVQSMTKSWAIPGLRLGYVLADASIISAMRRLRPDWSVNSIAQAVGIRALQDNDFLQQTRNYVDQQRQELLTQLQAIRGLHPFPGDANFLLVRIEHPSIDASDLAQQLLQKGIIIRNCNTFQGLDGHYFRLAVRTPDEQLKLCTELQQIFASNTAKKISPKTPAIMFQGTGSNAGKSILTAALCRILYQDGVSVAPFKAQNMSLNSCVTFQGGEMGRAQVLQAQACRLDADVRMNPVLLKPSSTTGSQVILCGKVLETMHFQDYAQRRSKIFPKTQQCYDELAAEHQVMVLEGAGSPAEINFKSRDIVNMNMARYADAKVLLVGDIDRGGVFASFVGTMELLNEWERKLVSGFIINRFRGDKNLLGDALDLTSLHTGKPFFGTVPFLADLGLPEEDSVDFKDGRFDTEKKAGEVLDIALIDLPHISNFTDVDALRAETDVHLRRVRHVDELGQPDVVILPGTKNVMSDLDYLLKSGLSHAIRHLAETETTEIVGICGGYQLLGGKITDPHAIESAGGDGQGLGLLAMETTLQPDKTTTHCQAIHLPSGKPLHGYEIHHGTSNGNNLKPIIQRADGMTIGGCMDGPTHIWGTYLHGIFDADGFRHWFLDRVRQRKGWQVIGARRASYDLEPALDRLADHVRASVDMDKIYQVLGL
ncbi:L-threonine O-3-phosphate decarboxylase /adenosylcobyric acid synthase (glutamine-hydrolysing) [Desulfuromusa kysingii]|uniref:Cobyric acid synthase n=1 Tax=Desulfuromusa kysingii TaxID=37625 RepID=A0A1H3X1W8_9BACT|nr:cobyric acid synthase [Desulfuromusa kysingii]SDZ92981.1 L-threonine O-3-phosphate decarboxylase /adenosylcobyric acid synthase (glutamine-hydrolysing) [Desulfuromusa kysingii]